MNKKEKTACPKCGKLVERVGLHLNYCLNNSEKENVPVKEEAVDGPKAPESSKIKLKFRQSIWVGINGKSYEGKEIEVDDLTTASEIVRLAKESYGSDILI